MATYAGSMEMKRTVVAASIIGALCFSAACGGGDDGGKGEPAQGARATPAATAVTVPLKLLSVDIDSRSRIVIQAPEGAVAKDGAHGPQISAGDGFQLDLTPGTPSVEVTKKDIQANTVNVFKRFLAEDPVGVLWETEIGGKREYHFYVAVSALRGFACEDTKGTVFTEDQARLMYQSCHTIAPAAVPR